MVLGEELGNAVVMLAVLTHVVRLVPANLELLPAADPRRAHFGDGDAVGTTPALTHLAVGGYGQANDHRATPRATRLSAPSITQSATPWRFSRQKERRAPEVMAVRGVTTRLTIGVARG